MIQPFLYPLMLLHYNYNTVIIISLEAQIRNMLQPTDYDLQAKLFHNKMSIIP